MSDSKPVLLLPGPASAAAAETFFGTSYQYGSYLKDNYFDDATPKPATNGALSSYAGMRVQVWQAPARPERDFKVNEIIRELLRLKCQVEVIALGDDDQLEPHVAAAVDMPRAELLAWAKERKRAVEVPPPVPRETKVTRGKPRSRKDGSNPKGEQVEGATGSVFVSWERLGLKCNSQGVPYPHLANVYQVLVNHPDLVGRIWFDEFHGKVFQTLFQDGTAEWSDTHDTRMTIWIQDQLRLARVGHQTVQRAVDDFARRHVRNEPKEWMDGLTWDHRERLPMLFPAAFGARENDYNSAIGRCWLVSMVARIYQPGCKVDTMPVFEGAQGIRKSSALAVIGGPWFSEMHEDMTSKDFLQNLPGKMLIEISELHAFRRAEIDRIKGIISCATDRYRASYGRRAEDHPRRGVWAGTTNRKDWVQDDTGARRFWPVACGKIDIDYLERYRDQLFAEAVYRFKLGEPWWDVDPKLAEAEQDLRRIEHPWVQPITEWTANRVGPFTTNDVFEFALDSIPVAQRTDTMARNIGQILRKLGFEAGTNRILGDAKWSWKRAYDFFTTPNNT